MTAVKKSAPIALRIVPGGRGSRGFFGGIGGDGGVGVIVVLSVTGTVEFPPSEVGVGVGETHGVGVSAITRERKEDSSDIREKKAPSSIRKLWSPSNWGTKT